MTDKLDWPQELIRREAKPVEPPGVPTRCPFCKSERIFIGSGNLRCYHCNTIIRLEGTSVSMSDLGREAGAEAGQELRELQEQYRGQRGAEKQR